MCWTVQTINKFNTGWIYPKCHKTKLCKRANVRLQAAHNSQLRWLLSSDDPNHQRGVVTSLTVTMSAVQSHTPNVTPTRCLTVAVHRRWGGSLWATTTIAVESQADLFVASHWLERCSSRFTVTLRPLWSVEQITVSQYFTSTNHLLCGFYLNF